MESWSPRDHLRVICPYPHLWMARVLGAGGTGCPISAAMLYSCDCNIHSMNANWVHTSYIAWMRTAHWVALCIRWILFTMASGGHYITMLLAYCIKIMIFLSFSFYGERCYGIHLLKLLVTRLTHEWPSIHITEYNSIYNPPRRWAFSAGQLPNS